jgi:hypothetical protein
LTSKEGVSSLQDREAEADDPLDRGGVGRCDCCCKLLDKGGGTIDSSRFIALDAKRLVSGVSSLGLRMGIACLLFFVEEDKVVKDIFASGTEGVLGDLRSSGRETVEEEKDRGGVGKSILAREVGDSGLSGEVGYFRFVGLKYCAGEGASLRLLVSNAKLRSGMSSSSSDEISIGAFGTRPKRGEPEGEPASLGRRG